MRYLRKNTATTIPIGPFIDPDGVTPKTALTVTASHITLVANVSGSPTVVIDGFATPTGGDNNMVHLTGDDAGYYSLTLTAANTNYVGGVVLSLNDSTSYLPVAHEFMILPQDVYDDIFNGTIIPSIWEYVTRTLTEYVNGTGVPVVVGDTVTLYNHSTELITVSNIEDQAEIWLTIKYNKTDPDASSIIQISKTGGLLYINGAAPVAPITSADGSVVVTGGNLICNISADAGSLLEAHSGLVGEVKTKTAGGVVTVVKQFTIKVAEAVAKAI